MLSARKMADSAIFSGADLVEIRADLIPGCDAESIRNSFSDILDRSIITLRSSREGGKSDLSGDERERWNSMALALDPAFLDLELDADRKMLSALGEKKGVVIVSKHLVDSWNPAGLNKTLSECCRLGAVGKVAARIKDVVDGVRLLESWKGGSSRFCLMGMGQGAELTRALAGAFGLEIVYCALDEDNIIAPGQLTLEAQKRANPKNSTIVGLIGHPLGHTLSPGMQNAAFKKLGIPGIYLPFDVPQESLVKDFMKGAAKLGVRGFNVTIPYKEIAFDSVDQLDDEARRARAVNTVLVQSDGTLKGFNTDIFGFAEALRSANYDPRNKRALIIGAGGASRAAVIALWKMGAKIEISNRHLERAEELVKSMRVFLKTLPLDELENQKPYSLIVNATPVGMRGFDGSPIAPEKLIAKAEAVMDMVYNPIETPLLNAAKPHGVKTIHGLDMLLHQGAKAFEIWTGQKAPIDVMRRELMGAIE
jgi:shikimate dehydrogenase/3-dehydroquinate dehydratase type I